MPVRSLRSSVLRWPDRADVDRAVRRWAEAVGRSRPEVLRIGYFGSYARSDWGVGSDLDLVAIVAGSDLPFHRRAVAWDLTPLPVPAELLVYTADEWGEVVGRGQFGKTLGEETVWVYVRDGPCEGREVPWGRTPCPRAGSPTDERPFCRRG